MQFLPQYRYQSRAATDAVNGGNDSFTELLLHMDGADTSTTFTDSSSNGFTVTANGNAQIDTALSKFGGASGLFDGTGDFLTITDNALLQPGSGDFTIDFWIRYNAGSVAQTIWSKGNVAAAAFLIQTDTSASPKIVCYAAGVTIVTETTGQATGGAFAHKAIVRSGSTITIFSDGTANGTGTTATDFNNSSTLAIGANADGTFGVNGWLDEFRFSKGIARWTANFTAPTAAYF